MSESSIPPTPRIEDRPWSTVLDCVLVLPGRGSTAEPRVDITIGHADGSVQRVRLDRINAQRIVERCGAIMLGPPQRIYGTREWLSRFSILRADSRVSNFEERIADDFRRQLPDVWEFAQELINSTKKLVARRGRAQVKPTTIARKLEIGLLVIVDALRKDT